MLALTVLVPPSTSPAALHMLTSPMAPSQPDGLRGCTRSIPLAATGRHRAVYCMSAPGKEQNRGRQSPLCCGGDIPAARRVSDVGPDIGRPSPAALPSGGQRSVPATSTAQTHSFESAICSLPRHFSEATLQRRRTPPATPLRSFPRTGHRSLAADLSDLRFPARSSRNRRFDERKRSYDGETKLGISTALRAGGTRTIKPRRRGGGNTAQGRRPQGSKSRRPRDPGAIPREERSDGLPDELQPLPPEPQRGLLRGRVFLRRRLVLRDDGGAGYLRRAGRVPRVRSRVWR